MYSKPFSVRLDPEGRKGVGQLAEATQWSVGQVINHLILEGLKLRRCPGILFTEGPAGRRATLSGCGVDVWEVIRVWKQHPRRTAFEKAFPQLSPYQLSAALTYYTCYPEEIDAWIERNRLSSEELMTRSPFIQKVRL